MNDKIRQGLKNSKGSSLAFVLIISMVLMVMVASIMTVANSDFTFTQKTVESRQAYIDAKSVIEFGKIEINDREKKLSDANKALVEATNNNGSTGLILQTIAQLEGKITNIYGNEKNVGETLSFTTAAGDGKVILGKVAVEKTSVSSIPTTESSQYVFKVVTENLRRKLDYKVDFNFVVTTTPGSSESLTPPIKPIAPNPASIPITNTSEWLSTKFTVTPWPKTPQCYIDNNSTGTYNNNTLTVVTTSSIKVNDFNWVQEKNLDLSAENIYFTASVPTNSKVYLASFKITANNELRFNKNYVQDNKKKNTLKAKNIIFEGDLEIGDASTIDIDCDNLWVKGNLIINTNNATLINKIKAKNIIIGDYESKNKGSDLTLSGNSNVVWEGLENLWVMGNININTNNTTLINSIKAKNIIINNTQNKKEGNITISNASKVELECEENIWIEGKVSVTTNSLSAPNTIKAKQIIIQDTNNNKNGSVTIGNATKVIWDCGNFWIDGDITTGNSSSVQEFNNIKYLETGNINLGHASSFKVTGLADSKNQMIVGTIKPVGGNNSGNNNHVINITNLCKFTCEGLELNWNSSLLLRSSIIAINNDFVLVSLKDSTNVPCELSCEYLECSGHTMITDLQSPLNFNPKNSMLNLRFAGGYTQKNSIVNINGADKVIFGHSDNNQGGGNDVPIVLTQDNVHTLTLNVKSDAIYLDSNTITIPINTDFFYGGKTNLTPNIFNIKRQVLGKGPGNYSNISGTILASLSGTLNIPYEGPSWPSPLVPSCAGGTGSSSIVITNGTEIYY